MRSFLAADPHSGVFGPALPAGRLSALDQLQAIDWQDSVRGEGYRIALWLQDRSLAGEGGDLVSVYRAGETRPGWNLAAREGEFALWCGVTGDELGAFGSIRGALDAIRGLPRFRHDS